MEFSRQYLTRLSQESNFIKDALEKVLRLSEILKFLNSDVVFKDKLALKGGTAINLTAVELPRLSVDIDLDFTVNVSRDDLPEIKEKFKKRLTDYMWQEGYSLADSRDHFALTSFLFNYINNAGNRDNIKVEINFLDRCHVLPLEKKKILTKGIIEDFEVLNHHQEVPFRILDKKYTFNAENSDNMIIHGDNLLALKSLLPQYEGLIDCIYIDPPYNTGKKEGQWVYSDNVDDPRIKKWLGEVVGAEGEDLSRHDKWLCMMYPRLKLLHKLLSNEGIIFISIDDNELASLKLCCDEIFGSSNFIGYLSVEINPKGRKNSDFISISNDYCVIYAKNKKDTYFLENIPKDKKDLSVDENGNLVHNSGKRVLVGENSFNNIVEDFNSKKHYTIYYNAEQGDMILKKETSLSEIDEDLVSKGYARYYSYSGEKFVENTYTADKIVELFENKALDFKNGKIYEKNFSSSIRIKSMD